LTIEHKDITGADLHEPKGVASANAGEIFIADGAGSGSWQHNIIANHGQMTVTNNATATSVTGAVDATLNTDTDYVKVTAGWGDAHVHGVTFNVDELVCAVDGHYELSFWASVKIPQNNNFVGIKFSVNDSTPYSPQKLVSQSATTDDYRNMMGNSGVDLTAGDTVSIYIAATKSDSLVVEEAGMTLQLTHEL